MSVPLANQARADEAVAAAAAVAREAKEAAEVKARAPPMGFPSKWGFPYGGDFSGFLVGLLMKKNHWHLRQWMGQRNPEIRITSGGRHPMIYRVSTCFNHPGLVVISLAHPQWVGDLQGLVSINSFRSFHTWGYPNSWMVHGLSMMVHIPLWSHNMVNMGGFIHEGYPNSWMVYNWRSV